MKQEVTVVGGGLAGLVASITYAEAGAKVRPHEAHRHLGGRVRASAPPTSPTRAPTSCTTTVRYGRG
jgi:heterodisulfide reductase subunit A-like polyferredoxin